MPKPMVAIGDSPILWHIMKLYSKYGINEFVICLGYKGYTIKEYFANYFLHRADVTFDIAGNSMEVLGGKVEPWKVTLIDTGPDTMTGGRLRRVREHVGDGSFCMTYGDGLADIDIGKLLAFHKTHGRAATVTAVRPPGRFGVLGHFIQEAARCEYVEYAGLQRHDHLVGQLQHLSGERPVHPGRRIEHHMSGSPGRLGDMLLPHLPARDRPGARRPQPQPSQTSSEAR